MTPEAFEACPCPFTYTRTLVAVPHPELIRRSQRDDSYWTSECTPAADDLQGENHNHLADQARLLSHSTARRAGV